MPRIARTNAPGVFQHVIARFVDRRWLFQDDEERAQYLVRLGRALARSDWRCVAWCLMSNHIHLGMIGGTRPLESWAKKTHAPFANWLNERHGRLGPVFAERPATFLVPAAQEASVLAYIHNNPVRANLASRARLSRWSSHRAYVGLDAAPPWLDVATGLRRTGFATARAFETFVDAGRARSLDVPDATVARRAVRRDGPFELASPILTEPVEFPIVARPFVLARTTPARVLDAVADHVGIAPLAATRRYGRGDISIVKRLVVHLCLELGISIAAATAVLNVSRQHGAVVAQRALEADERAIADRVLAVLSRGGPKSCQS